MFLAASFTAPSCVCNILEDEVHAQIIFSAKKLLDVYVLQSEYSILSTVVLDKSKIILNHFA